MLVKALISSVFRFVSGISWILRYATSLMSWSTCLSMSLHWDDPVWLTGCSNSLTGCSNSITKYLVNSYTMFGEIYVFCIVTVRVRPLQENEASLHVSGCTPEERGAGRQAGCSGCYEVQRPWQQIQRERIPHPQVFWVSLILLSVSFSFSFCCCCWWFVVIKAAVDLPVSCQRGPDEVCLMWHEFCK